LKLIMTPARVGSDVVRQHGSGIGANGEPFVMPRSTELRLPERASMRSPSVAMPTTVIDLLAGISKRVVTGVAVGPALLGRQRERSYRRAHETEASIRAGRLQRAGELPRDHRRAGSRARREPAGDRGSRSMDRIAQPREITWSSA
jgi:hypothetical protein